MGDDAQGWVAPEDTIHQLIGLCSQQQTQIEGLIGLIADLSTRVNVLEAHVLHQD